MARHFQHGLFASSCPPAVSMAFDLASFSWWRVVELELHSSCAIAGVAAPHAHAGIADLLVIR